MLITVLFMVSCDNDDDVKCLDPLTGALSPTETKFSGNWKLTGLMADDAIDLTNDKKDNPSKDIFAQYDDCEKDLVYDFMADRKFAFKQGSLAAKCEKKQTLSGTWKLTGKVLTFLEKCDAENINIELNENSDTFSYVSVVRIKDVKGVVKATKVKFTYKKAGTDVRPVS